MQKFTGLQYILIDIANNFGLDKENWDVRIDWAKDFLTKPVTEQNEIIEMLGDEPLLMRKAVNAYHDAINGVPTGHMVGLDATASGQQIMACLIGCITTATNVNLINTGKREDLNVKIATMMGMGQTRDDVKYPIMTHYFNSKRKPRDAFGEDTPELAKFYEALKQELPGAEEIMDDINGCWQGDVLAHQWVLPDNHTSHVPVMVQSNGKNLPEKVEVDELGGATFTYKYELNMAAATGISLPANIIHSIDGYIVREMIRRAYYQGFEVVTVHDAFFCSPNHCNELRQNYIDILCDIADSNLLGDILGQILGYEIDYDKYEIDYDKYTDDLSYYIKESEYALS